MPLIKSFILSFVLILTAVLLRAQQFPNTPADTNAVTSNSTPTGQASDDVIKKLSGLVHAGKYAEARQLASGLLLAYPDDQRLVKAKTLLDKLIATSNSSQPTNSVAQPAASGTSDQLTGMDKVDYNALIQRARDAQQTTDLAQQKTLLQQFMADSSLFLQKHPDQITLWEFRIASALILNAPEAGYEAGQKLLASGAADSNDPKMQQLLAQLKNKGWLDKEGVEAAKQKIEKDAEENKKYGWLLGTWDTNESWVDGGALNERNEHLHLTTEFSMSGSIIIGYGWLDGAPSNKSECLKYTDLTSTENPLLKDWQISFTADQWHLPKKFSISRDRKMMTFVFSGRTIVLTKNSDSQGQLQQSMQDQLQNQQAPTQQDTQGAVMRSLFGK